ncbi:MAG: GntR family transcriptional regulator [Candidatus Sumerlaeaceae bacterium]
MRIEINFKSGKPTYLQITEQVKYAAAAGTLRAGDQLPSIRDLAEQLRINRNTVSKAYAELEHEGVVDLQHGRGVFVASNGSPFKKRVRDEILVDAIDAAVVQAHHFQVMDDDLINLVRQRLHDFQKRRASA